MPSHQTAAESQAKKAATQSSARATLQPGEQVTYEQVLADPDNIELNFRYANSQVARGDLRGASATLERILLINPNLTRARLFYGIVLFRLDNLEESERVLRDVRKQSMPDSLRAEIDGYLHDITLQRRMTRFLSSLSLGYEFDTNRNAAPDSKRRLLAGTPLALGSGTNRKRRDTSLLSIYNATVIRDLGLQGGHEAFLSFDHYLQEQTAIDSLDLQSISFRAGGVLKSRLAQFTPAGFAEHILLSRETFLRSEGAELNVERDLSKRVSVFGTGRWAHEAYDGITENASAPERSGDQLWAGGGLEYLLTPTMRLSGSLTYNNKAAKAQYNAYDGHILTTAHTWIWPKGQFFISAFNWTYNHYNESDTAISAVRREDNQFRFRFTYGAPVSLVLGKVAMLRPVVKDLTATASFEQFHAASTVTNYAYTNSKFLMMLTKTVEF